MRPLTPPMRPLTPNEATHPRMRPLTPEWGHSPPWGLTIDEVSRRERPEEGRCWEQTPTSHPYKNNKRRKTTKEEKQNMKCSGEEEMRLWSSRTDRQRHLFISRRHFHISHNRYKIIRRNFLSHQNAKLKVIHVALLSKYLLTYPAIHNHHLWQLITTSNRDNI